MKKRSKSPGGGGFLINAKQKNPFIGHELKVGIDKMEFKEN